MWYSSAMGKKSKKRSLSSKLEQTRLSQGVDN